MYADDHDGQMPATLEQLANGAYLPLGSPIPQCRVARGPYHYLGAGRNWQASTNEISIYCEANHIGRTNVLYNDGRVTGTNSAAVKASMAAMKAGDTSQNRQ
jgi:prepilin-type processing-associated H-X9-DG protein